MRFHTSIDRADVHLDLVAEDLQGALEAAARAVSHGLGVAPSDVANALLERERLGSTSVGDGFAIPHCKLQGIKQIHLAVARLRDGVPFAAADERPVTVLFVVLSPPDQPAAHLQVLSQIARILKREDVRENLLSATNPEEFIEVVRLAAGSEGL